MKKFFIITTILLLAGLTVLLLPTRTHKQTVLNASYPQVYDLWQDTNKQRQAIHVQPLELDELLNQSATNKCQALVAANVFQHNLPDGRTFDVFIKETYTTPYLWASENLAQGYDAADTVTSAWMASTSHREALLDQKYDLVGYGVCHSRQYGTIVVQHFVDNQ